MSADTITVSEASQQSGDWWRLHDVFTPEGREVAACKSADLFSVPLADGKQWIFTGETTLTVKRRRYLKPERWSKKP